MSRLFTSDIFMTFDISPKSGSRSREHETVVDYGHALFLYAALVLWKERRQEWVGARQRPKAVEPREPVIRYTYQLVLEL